MFKNRTFKQAACNALNGLRVLYLEKSAKREFFILALTGFFCLTSLNFYTLIIFALSWILLALEAINTAIEMLCDLYTKMYDEKVKKIKDLASASIFLVICAQIFFVFMWILF